VDEPVPGDTIAGLVVRGTAALRASSETARLDAELLLAHVLDVDRGRLVLDHKAQVESESSADFEALIARRACGEPIAYLLGRRPFRALELTVDPRVLIPRPETEELVEAAVGMLPSGATVLDVGTGSGAIALALAAERPDLQVRGVDLSADAVTVAELNARRLNLDVSFTVADLLEGAPPADAVLANLPYVETAAQLPVDVADFEPAQALFGGPDGLDVIRRLAAQLATRPWPATALLEIGETQGAAVRALLRDAGFARVEVRPDLAGRDRIVVAHRNQGEG
jgi:release factor glutamine methyltransferase